MKIERIEAYDERFEKRIVDQHGAICVNDEAYSFEVIDGDTCRVFFTKDTYLKEAVEEYRFYAGHISRFMDEKGTILMQFPKKVFFDVKLRDIYVSQFYVSEEKLQRLAPYIHDFLIPVVVKDGKVISLDGHTRMKLAQLRGKDSVSCYLDEDGGYLMDFVREAHKRGVDHVYDMEILSKEEYELRWIKFCDDYFKNKEKE